jgi:hypothetical protein
VLSKCSYSPDPLTINGWVSQQRFSTRTALTPNEGTPRAIVDEPRNTRQSQSNPHRQSYFKNQLWTVPMSLRSMRVRPQKSALFVSPEKDENDEAAVNAETCFKSPSSALKEARLKVVYSTPSSAKKESPKLFSPPSALKEARLHSKALTEPDGSAATTAVVLMTCLASLVIAHFLLSSTESPPAPACHWDWLRGCTESNLATSGCRFVIGWFEGHIDLDFCRGIGDM